MLPILALTKIIGVLIDTFIKATNTAILVHLPAFSRMSNPVGIKEREKISQRHHTCAHPSSDGAKVSNWHHGCDCDISFMIFGVLWWGLRCSSRIGLRERSRLRRMRKARDGRKELGFLGRC